MSDPESPNLTPLQKWLISVRGRCVEVGIHLANEHSFRPREYVLPQDVVPRAVFEEIDEIPDLNDSSAWHIVTVPDEVVGATLCWFLICKERTSYDAFKWAKERVVEAIGQDLKQKGRESTLNRWNPTYLTGYIDASRHAYLRSLEFEEAAIKSLEAKEV